VKMCGVFYNQKLSAKSAVGCPPPRAALLLTGHLNTAAASNLTAIKSKLIDLLGVNKQGVDVVLAVWSDQNVTLEVREALNDSENPAKIWWQPFAAAGELIRQTHPCHPHCYGDDSEEAVTSQFFLANKAWSMLEPPEQYDMVFVARIDLLPHRELVLPCPIKNDTLYEGDYIGPNHPHGKKVSLPATVPNGNKKVSMPLNIDFGFGTPKVMQKYCSAFKEMRRIMNAAPKYCGSKCSHQQSPKTVIFFAENILGMLLFDQFYVVKWLQFKYELPYVRNQSYLDFNEPHNERFVAITSVVGLLIVALAVVVFVVRRKRREQRRRLSHEYELACGVEDDHTTIPLKTDAQLQHQDAIRRRATSKVEQMRGGL